MWFYCRRYSATEVERWGLVNKVVPGADLLAEAQKWGEDAAALSPTALKFLKCAFNLDGGGTAEQALFADAGLQLYLGTDECQEGRNAFNEKRTPDFASKRQ
jgi:naphthoate synthase